MSQQGGMLLLGTASGQVFHDREWFLVRADYKVFAIMEMPQKTRPVGQDQARMVSPAFPGRLQARTA